MIGQHIRILKSGRWVHAVDCGDETVLHLAAEAPPPRVRRAYRPEFVAGADAVEVVTHRERTFPPREIVKRAYSRASDPALASTFADSESFVEWCTTGRLSAARNFAVEVPGFAPAAAAPAPRVTAAKAAPQVKARAAAPARAPKAKAAVEARPAPKAKAARSVKAKAAAGRPAAARKRPGATAAKPARKVAARGGVARKPAAKAKGAGKAAARARVQAGRGGKAGRPAKAGAKARRGRR